MKTVIVPAQITTVEDKIAGNLTMQQLVLLIMPVFIGFSIYVILPKQLYFSNYKIAMLVLISAACGILAIRVKGKLILNWLVTIIRYNLRPRYFVFNKNTDYLRNDNELEYTEKINTTTKEKSQSVVTATNLTTQELIRLQNSIDAPGSKLKFRIVKGELHVSFSKVE